METHRGIRMRLLHGSGSRLAIATGQGGAKGRRVVLDKDRLLWGNTTLLRLNAKPTEEGGGESPAKGVENFDPTELIVYGGRLPSRRRLFLGSSLALVTALGANFLGCTSALLSLDGGKLASQYNLDVLYAVNGFRRSFDADNGYTFLFPQDWLADQTLLRRYARRIEQQNSLDPPPLRKEKRKRRAQTSNEPVCAYGPPGTSGELNVSVVVAPIEDGFTLRGTLGTPSVAGNLILSTFIAPSSQSDKSAELISASESGDYYVLEYTVRSQSKGWVRHNLAVYGSANGQLFTLNCQCPENQWSAQEQNLRTVATCCKLLPHFVNGVCVCVCVRRGRGGVVMGYDRL